MSELVGNLEDKFHCDAAHNYMSKYPNDPNFSDR